MVVFVYSPKTEASEPFFVAKLTYYIQSIIIKCIRKRRVHGNGNASESKNKCPCSRTYAIILFFCVVFKLVFVHQLFILEVKAMYQKLNENASKSRTRLYNIWKMMRKRCNNSNRSDYKYYGGRGIKVCEEWNNPTGYDNFKEWALKNGYKDYLTIDRIDPDGDYTPDNCRWITMRAQSFNKRDYKKEMSLKEMRMKTLTYKGKTLTIGEWAKKLNMDHHVLRRRIDRGWSTERIIETPYDATHSRRKK